MSALVETMFYVGAEPWHGQGTKLDSPPTSKEAIIAAGLDWDVEARPLFDFRFISESLALGDQGLITHGNYATDPNDMEPVPGVQCVRRETDGRVLGIVGPRWKPVQNREAFGWFDPLVQDGLALYHTAGSLRDGQTIWILAQIGDEAQIVGDDRVGQFLLLNMGHDGIRGINFLPTSIRVVCANTLSWAEAAGMQSTARFMHAGNVVERMEEFRDVIRLFLHDFEQTNEVFRLMAGNQMRRADVDLYLDNVFPWPKTEDGGIKETSFGKKLRETLIRKFEGDLLGYEVIPEENRKTLWTIYNAVTEYVDHERGSDTARLESGWMGDGALIKKRALVAAKKALNG